MRAAEYVAASDDAVRPTISRSGHCAQLSFSATLNAPALFGRKVLAAFLRPSYLNHRQHTSSGNISDHWGGMAAALGVWGLDRHARRVPHQRPDPGQLRAPQRPLADRPLRENVRVNPTALAVLALFVSGCSFLGVRF
jgi:hypothetical protein